MFNRTSKNDDININQSLKEMADSLEEVLKSYGSDIKDEMDSARSKAHALLKQIHAKLNSNNRILQTARDTGYKINEYMHDKPWQGVGVAAIVGLVLGVLLMSRR